VVSPRRHTRERMGSGVRTPLGITEQRLKKNHFPCSSLGHGSAPKKRGLRPGERLL